MIPEPALRPAAARGPGLELCYRSRLYLDGGDLVLQTRTRTRRFPIGGDGITRAVFLDAPGDDMERRGPTIEGSWGKVQLQDRDGALIGLFNIEDWLPESPAIPKRWVRGEQLLDRTGMAALFKAAGIPLHVVTDRNDPLLATVSRRHRAVSLSPGNEFPWWYLSLRAVAFIVWFALFTVILFFETTEPWVILLLAATALVAPVARLVVRTWTRLRLRECVPVVRERVRPAPVDGTGTTVRFCRDTELRVQDRDLVLRVLGGREYWLPLTGPHALTSLVLVRDRTGQPLGVEVRGPHDQVRAIFLWPLWFGGRGGADGWSRLRRTAGLSVSERKLAGKAPWPKALGALGTDLLPDSAGTARKLSRFPSTFVGLSSTATMMVGSYFSIAQGQWIQNAHPGAGMAAILAGAIGLFLQAVPYAAHQLGSRLRLERPALGQTPTERLV
ncbi:hypothetical protein ACIP4X_10360 [Streptomyces sp. NPDC088817]|uniref:hypothetical protein n=1 Tax=Streptomyces sp. NPDC088817 TaxID=3365907 RepID=UPI0038110F95